MTRTVPGIATTARAATRRALAGIAAIALAAAGALATAPGTTIADTHRDGQWYLDDFNIDKVHKLSQGEGVKIGVIDSGFDASHPDLKNNITEGAEFDENGKTAGDAHTDDSGHGTAVASVLAGHGHGKNNANGILGIAPKATIIPAKLDFEEGKFAQGSPEFTHAFEWLLEQDVNIISVSLGSGSDPETDSQIAKALEKGIPVISSAGNVTTSESQWGEITNDRIGWPATVPGVIPVAGTNENSKFWDGSVTLEGAPLQPQLGISAPAANIPMAQPDSKYSAASGTSLAAPIVAGTLALIKSAYPNLGIHQIDERLLFTVDDKGKKGFDDKYGWGIVNPYKALTAKVEHYNGPATSKDDIVPLAEQGDPVKNVPAEDTGPTPKIKPNPDDQDETNHATDTSPTAPPTWLVTTIVATGALLIAALITLVTIKTRRNKKHATASQTPPPGMPPPPDHTPPGIPTPPGTPPPPPGLNQPPPQTHQAGNQNPQPPPDPNTNPPQ